LSAVAVKKKEEKIENGFFHTQYGALYQLKTV
jgi:hypothetical protein